MLIKQVQLLDRAVTAFFSHPGSCPGWWLYLLDSRSIITYYLSLWCTKNAVICSVSFIYNYHYACSAKCPLNVQLFCFSCESRLNLPNIEKWRLCYLKKKEFYVCILLPLRASEIDSYIKTWRSTYSYIIER